MYKEGAAIFSSSSTPSPVIFEALVNFLDFSIDAYLSWSSGSKATIGLSFSAFALSLDPLDLAELPSNKD
jgi:hypothetical protein